MAELLDHDPANAWRSMLTNLGKVGYAPSAGSKRGPCRRLDAARRLLMLNDRPYKGKPLGF
jgi:hypothetical protein